MVMFASIPLAASALLVAQSMNFIAISFFFDCFATAMPHDVTMNGEFVFGPAGKFAMPTLSAPNCVLAGSMIWP